MKTNKLQIDKHFRQLILLDVDGQFVKSNDLIFSTEKLRDIPIKKWFPFIESICENLKNLEKEDEELMYSGIVHPAAFLPGIYDFCFYKTELEGCSFIVWSIYDYSVVYSFLTKYQQLKNEKDIYRQKLEYKYKHIQNVDELFS